MSDQSGWPLTIDEAVDRLMNTLSHEEKSKVRDSSAEDGILFHFGLGLFIRDEFGLNSGNEALLAACAREEDAPFMHDPDSASGVIIDALICRLRNESAGR
jgi:hypothetical protein